MVSAAQLPQVVQGCLEEALLSRLRFARLLTEVYQLLATADEAAAAVAAETKVAAADDRKRAKLRWKQAAQQQQRH